MNLTLYCFILGDERFLVKIIHFPVLERMPFSFSFVSPPFRTMKPLYIAANVIVFDNSIVIRELFLWTQSSYNFSKLSLKMCFFITERFICGHEIAINHTCTQLPLNSWPNDCCSYKSTTIDTLSKCPDCRPRGNVYMIEPFIGCSMVWSSEN